MKTAAHRGNIVIFGATSGPADPISPNGLMGHSLRVSGGSLLNYILTTQELMERAKAVLDGIEKGWLKLRIDHTFPYEKAAEAHQKLENRQTSGKVVLTIT